MNIEITLDKDLLNDRDYDFFHYQESFELAICEYGTFYITSRGDLRCFYTDTEKGIETEDYYDIINYYVRNNEEYINAIDSGKLVFDLNNWFSIDFITNNGEYLDYFDYLDNVYGSISECLDMFNNIINNEEEMKEIMQELKEKGCAK